MRKKVDPEYRTTSNVGLCGRHFNARVSELNWAKIS